MCMLCEEVRVCVCYVKRVSLCVCYVKRCVRVYVCVFCYVKVCVCVLLRGVCLFVNYVERCLFVCSLCLHPKTQPTMDACRCRWSNWRG